MNRLVSPLVHQASTCRAHLLRNKLLQVPHREYSKDMSGVAVQLAVVDRHTEVERLLRTAELNHARGTDGKPLVDKPFLLYSSQVFGSGKTTFGTYVSTLIRDKVVEERLLRPSETADISTPGDLVDLRRDQKFTEDLLNSYKEMKTVVVDLKEGLSQSSSQKDVKITFQESLYHALYCSAVGRIPIAQFFEEIKNVIEPNALMHLLVEKTGHKGKWFFFIDEIGYTERLATSYPDIQHPAGYTSNKIRKIDVYTRLFDILHQFITREDCFAFCAGKSAALTEKSLEESGSPLRLRLLALSALQPEHICEVLRKTTHKGETLQKALGVSDELLPVFAEIVFLYTGGIPRLIRRTFESLLSRHEPVPQSRDEIIKVFVTDLSYVRYNLINLGDERESAR